MIQIPNLTKEQVEAIIAKVALNHKNKIFGSYTARDIEQEVWVIALSKLGDFNFVRSTVDDPAKALEHWLNRIVTNALSNFKRDKFINKQKHIDDKTYKKKLNVLCPIEINELLPDSKWSILDNLSLNEYWDLILKDMSDELFDVLEALLNNEKINCYYKNKLIRYIQEICPTLKKVKGKL